ncbi:MAG: hypothetical protein IPJ77_15185 [Planctomycetes bacterium]|nr:hypothetical protein [Planctomycetota bacterium]
MEVLFPLVGFLAVLAVVLLVRKSHESRTRAALGALAVQHGLHVTDDTGFLGFDVRAYGTLDGLEITAQPVRRRSGRRRHWFTRVSARFGRPVRARVDVRPRGLASYFASFAAAEVPFGGDFSLNSVVLSDDTALARAWLTDDVRAAFASFPKDAILRLEKNEVALEWRGHGTEDGLLSRALDVVVVAGKAARDAN